MPSDPGLAPSDFEAMARGAELKAAVHSRIADIVEESEVFAETTPDEQVRVGVLAWVSDSAREHRIAARQCIGQARDLYEQAARAAAV